MWLPLPEALVCAEVGRTPHQVLHHPDTQSCLCLTTDRTGTSWLEVFSMATQRPVLPLTHIGPVCGTHDSHASGHCHACPGSGTKGGRVLLHRNDT